MATDRWARFRDSGRFSPGAVGGQFQSHCTTDGAWGNHSVYATWTAGGLPPGEYVVEYHMPDPDPTDPTGAAGDCLDRWTWTRGAPWRIYPDGNDEAPGASTGELDQSRLGAGWHTLNAGRPVHADGELTFRMTSHTGERCRAVAFDAVRIRRVCP